MHFPEFNLVAYPAFDILSTDIAMDRLRGRFLTDILVKCNKTSKLILPYYRGNALDNILGLFNPILNEITCIDIWGGMYHVFSFKDTEMFIKGEGCSDDDVDIIESIGPLWRRRI